MAAAVTLVRRHSVGGITQVLCTIVLSNSPAAYPGAPGEPLDISAVMGYTNREPDFGEISGTSGLPYVYDPVNDTLRAYTAFGTELTATNYTGAMTGDTITALFTFISTPKLS